MFVSVSRRHGTCGRWRASPSVAVTAMSPNREATAAGGKPRPSSEPKTKSHSRKVKTTRRSVARKYKSGSTSSRHGGGGNAPPFEVVQECDVLVLGSGVAGMTCALEAAEAGLRAAIVTKAEASEGSTKYAQGGVAAVMTDPGSGGGPVDRRGAGDPRDSVSRHVEDTMSAGCFLNDREAVEIMCREGPAQVDMLRKIGVTFTEDAGSATGLHLVREGGHSHSRVVHAADATGAAMMRALVKRAAQHPNVSLHENHFALDLLTMPLANGEGVGCYGCDAICAETGDHCRFVSKCTVVATGGCGQIYPSTTNPVVATGDGIAMAARAGAAVEDMEFIQFHPTSLYDPARRCSLGALGSVFLVSEAVRGAGATLRNLAGEAFMAGYDPRGDLAPRDVVARGIYDQMRLHGGDHVYLDATHLSRERAEEEFPHISRNVRERLGLEISQDWIPVVPAQHYACGGILTNTEGETTVRGLYAIGEAARTGVHGANRLASNSLLEGLVFGRRSVLNAIDYVVGVHPLDLEAATHACPGPLTFPREAQHLGVAPASAGDAEAADLVQRIQRTMWSRCGILRNDKDLAAGLRELEAITREIEVELKESGCRSLEQAEALNMATVASLVMSGAAEREASAGLHHNVDKPPTARQLATAASREPAAVGAADK